jgi:cob(I)alamin adenosyltransferase
LSKIQHDIFSISSEAASLPEDEKKLKIALVAKPHIQFLEKKIDEMTLELPKLKSFILPGGLQISALAHVCRTITRRAERLLIGIDETLKMRKEISVYINRLSDYFFTLARYLNYQNNVEDVQWKQ